MRRHIRHYIHRHEPKGVFANHLKSGLGAMVAMIAVGGLAAVTGLPLLIAPFGASAVLLFGQPKSPLAQPANVFGGYLVALCVASLCLLIFPTSWPFAALAVGLAIAAMAMLRVTHPPAGAVPLVAFASKLGIPVLFAVVIIGSLVMIAIAVVVHRIPPRHPYPLPAPAPAPAPEPRQN